MLVLIFNVDLNFFTNKLIYERRLGHCPHSLMLESINWLHVYDYKFTSLYRISFYYSRLPGLKLIALDICGLGWTLFQTMFGGRNSMSRSTFGSHNDKKTRWNYFLLAIKWLQIRYTYIAILIYHNLVTFVI